MGKWQVFTEPKDRLTLNLFDRSICKGNKLKIYQNSF